MNAWEYAFGALNVAGAIASLGAAIFALCQARKAKRYREEVKSDRQKMAIIDLAPLGTHIRKEARKLTSQYPATTRGINRKAVLDAIRDYAERIGDRKHRLGTVASQLLVDLECCINAYLAASDDNDAMAAGDKIYGVLCGLNEDFQRQLDAAI